MQEQKSTSPEKLPSPGQSAMTEELEKKLSLL